MLREYLTSSINPYCTTILLLQSSFANCSHFILSFSIFFVNPIDHLTGQTALSQTHHPSLALYLVTFCRYPFHQPGDPQPTARLPTLQDFLIIYISSVRSLWIIFYCMNSAKLKEIFSNFFELVVSNLLLRKKYFFLSFLQTRKSSISPSSAHCSLTYPPELP